MKPYFMLLDESGSLNDKRERFFALGLLRVRETHRLTDAVYRVNQRLISDMRWRRHEFKFNDLRTETLPYYKQLVDVLFAQPEYHLCVLVVDKHNPTVDWRSKFDTVWDAYIVYSRMLVTHCMGSGDASIVIADYLGKPTESSRYYELEVMRPFPCSFVPGEVLNATMIDSKAAPLVQLVDVLLGAVRYDHLRNREPLAATKAAKIELCDHVRGRLGWTTLLGDRATPAPTCFRVWEFRPKRPAQRKSEPSG